MRRKAIRCVIAVGILVAGCLAACAQTPAAAQTVLSGQANPPAARSAEPAAGGKLHGIVKSGNTPLPGVTVTAQNTLTGKRYSTTTDITGTWSLAIPLNGRYVVRTQFAAFAQGSQEALLNASNRGQTVTFNLMLASRAAQQEKQEEQGAPSEQAMQAIRQLAGNGAQSLNLLSALMGDTENQNNGSGMSGAALPSIAGSSDFSEDSVAISGQTGQVSPLAGLDMDRIRDAIETLRLQNGGQGGPGGQQGVFVLNSGGGGGGFGVFMGGRGGGFGGGRMNFRNFNPAQPHGAIFWMGSNSALDALPFALNGQPQVQPASGANRFGVTFISAPYLPHLTKPSGKDTVFLTLSGSRDSSPLDQYAVVPTDAERRGDFSAAGLPPVYDPANDTLCNQFGATPGQPFPGNIIPSGCLATPATALLRGNNTVPQFFPEPNLTDPSANGYNYHLLTTAQTNNTQLGIRYMRVLGKGATLLGSRGFGRRSQQSQGLRQNLHLNYNWSRSAEDNVNLFPLLGGNSSTGSNSLQAGYTLGYNKITSIFNASWNRSNLQTLNYFTNGTDVATQVGILGPDGAALNANPLDYGLPGITLGQFAGLNQQQPNFSLSQTISISETISWIRGKHNIRFGGDYRRVHRDFLGGSNSTGSFTFSGKFTQDPAGTAATGSALADFLLGLPQGTAIDVAAQKSYLRQNVMDLYVQDDWRMKPFLTLNYGLRYEFFAPYTEKYGRLAFVDTNPLPTATSAAFGGLSETQVGGTAAFSGPLPSSLVHPFRLGLAPRIGFALRLPRQTVLRGGFDINYTNSQYATFATAMARQPMVNQPTLVNEQTNIASTAGAFTLANGFPSPATVGSYAVDPHYRLPYVQVWNLDIQKTLPWGVVMNVGYNGSKGNHLDITSAPRATVFSPLTDPGNLPFNYEQSAAFSKFNAGTLRLNKRLSNGIALGANYQYSHSIDNAGSVGGASTVVAQNWQNFAAEEGNSSFDQRHRVSGTYLYELPFGQDKHWLTTGAGSHLFEGFSISGSFVFATGFPLTPSYMAAVSDVAHGTAGTLRPNLVPGASPSTGGGSLKKWFNTAAYSQPTPDTFGNAFGNAPRNSITGPGTVQNNMSLSKTMQLGETRSMELRATANNVFNTVQYSGVDTKLDSATAGQITSAASMRSFQFTARFRF
jgi:hypothetical protein